MSRSAALRKPAAMPANSASQDSWPTAATVELTPAQIIARLTAEGEIRLPLDVVLANTSSCFKRVIEDRRRTYHRQPEPMAKVFAHVDRAFAVVFFKGADCDLLLPLDIWVMRSAG
jgi:hypothetical protein